MPFLTQGYAAYKASEPLRVFSFERRDIGPLDVHLKIMYCGICHSDIHQVKDELTGGSFPMVPGHEIVGIVESVGKNVKKLKKGDIGAVGCYVNSCFECEQCQMDEEQHCLKNVATYNGRDYDNKLTYGGYSKHIVVTERFVFKVPESLRKNLAAVAPLLCAGITTWSPMIHHGMNKPGKRIGVIGLGGLGHMVVKFGVAFGNEVTVISTSENKREEAINVLGAKNFVVSKNPEQMAEAASSLNFLISTIYIRDLDTYMNLLKPRGLFCQVGVTEKLVLNPISLIRKSRVVAGSLVGGTKQTQEMLDFCGEKGISATIEITTMDKINVAYERILKSDVRYRFVIDVDNSEI